MDIDKKPASPGVYVVLLAASVLALVLVWTLGDVVVDWIAGPAEPPMIAAPTE